MANSRQPTHYLKNLAGANKALVSLVKKELSTPVNNQNDGLSNDGLSDVNGTLKNDMSDINYETWQDLWIVDHKPPVELDQDIVGTILFHYSLPAIFAKLENGKWVLPKENEAREKKVLISNNLFYVKVASQDDIPIDVSKRGFTWVIIGQQQSWGYGFSKELHEVLESVSKHSNVPLWSGAWALASTNSLASVIAFGGITETYSSYESAESEKIGNELVLVIAQSGGETEETLVLGFGTKVPSTQVPITRTFFAPK